jgi:hypothetical protein
VPVPQPVTVVEESESGFIRQRWVFSFHGDTLRLDRYSYERRYSASGQFQVTKFYDRGHDGEDYGTWTWLTAEEVPWDDDLKAAAIAEVVKRLRIEL